MFNAKTYDELIDIIDKELIEMKDMNEFLDKQPTHFYYKKMEAAKNLSDHMRFTYKDISDKTIKNMETLRDLYVELKNMGIDIFKSYEFIENVEMSFWPTDSFLRIHFYFKDDKFLYENYCSSHSELGSWIQTLIEKTVEEYEDIMGYDNFEQGINLKSLTDIRDIDSSKVKEMAKTIKNVIDFVENNGYYQPMYGYVAGQVSYKLESIKELIEKRDY